MTTNPYPVPGYRNPAAKAKHSARAFRAPSDLRWHQYAGPNTPLGEFLARREREMNPPGRRLQRGPVPLVRRASRYVPMIARFAVSRHPVVRAAQLAWDLKEFLPQPGTTPIAAQAGYSAWESYDWIGPTAPCNNQAWNGRAFWWIGASNASVGPCYVGQFGNGGAWPAPGSLSWQVVRLHAIRWVSATNRWNSAERWWRPYVATNGNNAPQWTTYPAVEAVASMQYGVRPPPPVPYKLIPKLRDSPMRQSGNRAPGDPPALTKPARPATERPPNKWEREKKGSPIMGWGGFIRTAVEMSFEGLELVGIANKALPKDCRAPKGSTGAQQFAAVWSCLDRMDQCKFFQGLINNKIEDAAYGLLGKAAKKEAQSMGRAYGLSGVSKKLAKPLVDGSGYVYGKTAPDGLLYPQFDLCP